MDVFVEHDNTQVLENVSTSEMWCLQECNNQWEDRILYQAWDGEVYNVVLEFMKESDNFSIVVTLAMKSCMVNDIVASLQEWKWEYLYQLRLNICFTLSMNNLLCFKYQITICVVAKF